MTLRAVSKSKRKARPLVCDSCHGEMKPVPVTVYSRDGEPSEGIQVVHVPCETCDSTGKVKRRVQKACCCSGPRESRCDGCANARRGGAEVHVCGKPTEDEIAFETELEFAASPRTRASDAGRNSTAADLGVGERSGQRGNR